jgi:hypothetical protein
MESNNTATITTTTTAAAPDTTALLVDMESNNTATTTTTTTTAAANAPETRLLVDSIGPQRASMVVRIVDSYSWLISAASGLSAAAMDGAITGVASKLGSGTIAALTVVGSAVTLAVEGIQSIYNYKALSWHLSALERDLRVRTEAAEAAVKEDFEPELILKQASVETMQALLETIEYVHCLSKAAVESTKNTAKYWTICNALTVSAFSLASTIQYFSRDRSTEENRASAANNSYIIGAIGVGVGVAANQSFVIRRINAMDRAIIDLKDDLHHAFSDPNKIQEALDKYSVIIEKTFKDFGDNISVFDNAGPTQTQSVKIHPGPMTASLEKIMNILGKGDTASGKEILEERIRNVGVTFSRARAINNILLTELESKRRNLSELTTDDLADLAGVVSSVLCNKQEDAHKLISEKLDDIASIHMAHNLTSQLNLKTESV